MKLFDLHTHILPAVDDGAKDLETALEMIRFAAENHTRAIALTPHVTAEEPEDFLRQAERHRRTFDLLSEAARDLGVFLYLGGEVRISPFLYENIFHLPLPTLNKSRYLLTEFPFYFPADAYKRILYDLFDAGYIPIIAHPERYDAVQRNPEIVEQWVDLGCHLQITSGSIMGSFGRGIRALSEQLIKNDLVCLVASDAHDVTHRSANLLPVYQRLSDLVSPEYAELVVGGGNARKILTDSAL